MITPDDLRGIEPFSDLSAEDLAWLAERFEERILNPGDTPYETGAPAEHMFVLFSGRIQALRRAGEGWRVFDTFGPGTVSGVLPYSRIKTWGGRGVVLEPTRVGHLHRDHFPEMLYRIPSLGQRLIGMMSDRVRKLTQLGEERERMVALGKLSAGLAHELNNPAAAVHRAADELRAKLDALRPIVIRLAAHGLDPETLSTAAAACRPSEPGTDRTPMELAGTEEALAEWLESRTVDSPWDIAPALAEAGLDPDTLELAVRDVPPAAVADVVAWMAHDVACGDLLGEIDAASTRISTLVRSVGIYSHMDRATDKQPTDVRQGIESTISMLGHRIRGRDVSVERDYDEPVPVIAAYPGELNQVWTNLIENAIDASSPGGRIRVGVRVVGERLWVEVEDNGTGIPEEIRARIFEPFFTTRDVGEGTGLGLDIARRIVVRQHGGDITVDSRPGFTVFTVQLPIT